MRRFNFIATVTLAATGGIALFGSNALAGDRCRVSPIETPAIRIVVDDEAAVPVDVAESVIDIVFVLDTTGSMGGMIEGAKQKIWDIANSIAMAEPRPQLRIGLVAYRDRGDDYVTKRTALDQDLDTIYADLMAYAAAGGGNSPESVNQALHEAVTTFKWSEDPGALKVIYLVGDAPPRDDFGDDVDHPESCALAASRGIIINTLQCGSNVETTDVWKTIARAAEGRYLHVPQDGGAVVVATPFDDEINRLGVDLMGTMIDYGDRKVMERQQAKRLRGREVAESAAPAAASDRWAYSIKSAGRRTLLGEQELVSDIEAGKVTLAEIPVEHLPEAMRTMTAEERAAHVAASRTKRAEITRRLTELDTKRSAWRLDWARTRGGETRNAFDTQLLTVMAEQCAAKGIVIEAPVAPELEAPAPGPIPAPTPTPAAPPSREAAAGSRGGGG